MKYLLYFFCCLKLSQLSAQVTDVEYGTVSFEEMAIEDYAFNSDAVVLFDKGESYFYDEQNGGYNIRFTRHKRIKLYNSGSFELADVTVPFYTDGFGRSERIVSIKAASYTLKKGVIEKKELEKKDIYKLQLNDKNWVKSFAIPGVEEGSIIEFFYTLETPFHFRLPSWNFQGKYPVKYSEYKVNMIPFYEYSLRVQGIEKFDYNSTVKSNQKRKWGSVNKVYGRNVGNGIEFNDIIHTYALKDVPAFQDESYISSIQDFIIKMNFQLSKVSLPNGYTKDVISDWTELNKALLKHENFGKFIKKSSKYSKEILKTELQIEHLSNYEKGHVIIDFMKNNFVCRFIGNKYTDKTAKEFYVDRSGSSSEVNLFLIALLTEAGLDCKPLVLSTKQNGKLHLDYPYDQSTDYVVAFINDEEPYLADATDKLLPNLLIPIDCLHGSGLIVSKSENSGWVDIHENVTSTESFTISSKINMETLTADNTVSIKSTMYDAYTNRKIMATDSLGLIYKYETKIGTIDKVKISNYTDVTKPLRQAFHGIKELTKVEDNIILNPFHDFSMLKNKLIQESRTYPVSFLYRSNKSFNATIVIPEGYECKDFPESIDLDNDQAKIQINYSLNNNLLKVTGTYLLKKSSYAPTEYDEIKDVLDVIIDKFNEAIIISPIKE